MVDPRSTVVAAARGAAAPPDAGGGGGGDSTQRLLEAAAAANAAAAVHQHQAAVAAAMAAAAAASGRGVERRDGACLDDDDDEEEEVDDDEDQQQRRGGEEEVAVDLSRPSAASALATGAASAASRSPDIDVGGVEDDGEAPLDLKVNNKAEKEIVRRPPLLFLSKLLRQARKIPTPSFSNFLIPAVVEGDKKGVKMVFQFFSRYDNKGPP